MSFRVRALGPGGTCEITERVRKEGSHLALTDPRKNFSSAPSWCDLGEIPYPLRATVALSLTLGIVSHRIETNEIIFIKYSPQCPWKVINIY